MYLTHTLLLLLISPVQLYYYALICKLTLLRTSYIHSHCYVYIYTMALLRTCIHTRITTHIYTHTHSHYYAHTNSYCMLTPSITSFCPKHKHPLSQWLSLQVWCHVINCDTTFHITGLRTHTWLTDTRTHIYRYARIWHSSTPHTL